MNTGEVWVVEQLPRLGLVGQAARRAWLQDYLLRLLVWVVLGLGLWTPLAFPGLLDDAGLRYDWQRWPLLASGFSVVALVALAVVTRRYWTRWQTTARVVTQLRRARYYGTYWEIEGGTLVQRIPVDAWRILCSHADLVLIPERLARWREHRAAVAGVDHGDAPAAGTLGVDRA
jgi:hypothetical protein